MKYLDLRHFLAALEQSGDLIRLREPVSARLEMTAVGDFTLRRGGPALLFERPDGYKIPALTNLFGTTRRVALAMGATEVSELRDIGAVLANLKEPEPPKGLRDPLWRHGRPAARSSPKAPMSTSARCRSRRAGPRMPAR